MWLQCFRLCKARDTVRHCEHQALQSTTKWQYQLQRHIHHKQEVVRKHKASCGGVQAELAAGHTRVAFCQNSHLYNEGQPYSKSLSIMLNRRRALELVLKDLISITASVAERPLSVVE